MMRLFVTGSTGFIGSHFVRAALAAGHEVTALRFPGSLPPVPIECHGVPSAGHPSSVAGSKAVPSSLSWLDGTLDSVTDGDLSGHDAFIHLAAYGVSPQPCTWEKAFQINVLDSMGIMERSVACGIRKFVVCGSCVEYGKSAERYENIPADAPLEPIGPYAGSKAAQSVAASALCREKGVELAILRLFTVYGEGQHPDNLWPSLKRAALAGEDFPMSPGGQIRDFIPVGDVAQAFLREVEINRQPAPSNEQPGVRIANIGTGRPQTLLAFAEHWWKEWGAKGKLLPGALPYRDNEVMRYVPEVVLNCGNALRDIR